MTRRHAIAVGLLSIAVCTACIRLGRHDDHGRSRARPCGSRVDWSTPGAFNVYRHLRAMADATDRGRPGRRHRLAGDEGRLLPGGGAGSTGRAGNRQLWEPDGPFLARGVLAARRFDLVDLDRGPRSAPAGARTCLTRPRAPASTPAPTAGPHARRHPLNQGIETGDGFTDRRRAKQHRGCSPVSARSPAARRSTGDFNFDFRRLPGATARRRIGRRGRSRRCRTSPRWRRTGPRDRCRPC